MVMGTNATSNSCSFGVLDCSIRTSFFFCLQDSIIMCQSSRFKLSIVLILVIRMIGVKPFLIQKHSQSTKSPSLSGGPNSHSCRL